MIELRLRGLPPALWVSAFIAASPLAFASYARFALHMRIENVMLALCAAGAILPWLSRVVGRLSYRAAVDDLALHVGGEALLFSTITAVEAHSTWRRSWLILRRGRVLRVDLLTRDVFAGRLEPIDELMKRLPTEI